MINDGIKVCLESPDPLGVGGFALEHVQKIRGVAEV
jgi:hypothetical protein